MANAKKTNKPKPKRYGTLLVEAQEKARDAIASGLIATSKRMIKNLESLALNAETDAARVSATVKILEICGAYQKPVKDDDVTDIVVTIVRGKND